MTREWAYTNANVRTVDPHDSTAEAMLVRDARRCGRGPDPGARSRTPVERPSSRGLSTRNHLGLTALDAESLNCSPAGIPTIDDLLHGVTEMTKEIVRDIEA